MKKYSLPPSPPPPAVLRLLFRAAVAKGIRNGNRAALLERLESMGRDLFADCGFFASLFLTADAEAAADAIPTPTGIGDAFWRLNHASAEERRLDGSFYTPVVVIDAILDLLWKDMFPRGLPAAGEERTICDPAMGCGYFFLRLLERLTRNRPGAVRKARRWADRALYGVDLDAGAVFMCRALLWLALSDREEEFVPSPERFRAGDALLGRGFGESGHAGGDGVGLDWTAAFPEVAAAGGFDAVLGNPPYDVLTNFTSHPERQELAEALRASGNFHDALTGQINLHRCFVERSLELLKPGGSLSLVTPLSLARDAAAGPLRRRLLEREGTDRWLLFGEDDRLFPGVTQSFCIFRAVRGRGRAEKLRLVAKGETATLRLKDVARLSGENLTLPAADAADLRLLEWLEKKCPGRLADAADMYVGEVDQTFYRECMRDDDTGCLLARGIHLAPFRLDTNPVPGKARFLDRERFLAMKANTAAVVEKVDRPRIAQLGIRNMRTLPRLVAARVPPGVFLGNSLNAYSPKNGLSLEYLAGMLNADILDRIFRIWSGNNNINLREMKVLPFPAAPTRSQEEAVAETFRACEEAARTNPAALPECRRALNRAAAAAYGVETLE